MTSPDERAEALRADIERTREELGETVAELAHKADIRAPLARTSVAAAAGAVLALLAYLLWRRH